MDCFLLGGNLSVAKLFSSNFPNWWVFRHKLILRDKLFLNGLIITTIVLNRDEISI